MMAYKNIEEGKRYQKEYFKQYRKDNLKKLKKYEKQYRKDNSEKIKECSKQYYKDNSEKIEERSKQYYKNNSEKVKEYSKQWQKNNPEKRRERDKQYYKNNSEKVKEYSKQYRLDNLEKIREKRNQYRKDNLEKVKEYIKQYMKIKYKTDLKYNLNDKMSTAIGTALKGNKAGRTWESLTGYTLANLIKRLKKTMPRGYTWQDFLTGELHIDHIIPIDAFNFTRPEHTDFKRCWTLSNLRLLPAKENWSKHNRLNRPFQPALRI